MKSEKIKLDLGDENIFLQISEWKNTGIVYINLHEDEQTSVSAAKGFLVKGSGVLIELISKGNRLISFNRENNEHVFDPNRIYSSNGIKNTLNENGTYDISVEYILANLADSILEKVLHYKPSLIVALHNTTGEFSIDGYLSGGQFENDKADIHVNPEELKTDLFLTVDGEVFNEIKKGNYNVVLQDNDAVTDDGSLSVYCGKNNLRYVNVETKHGNLKKQIEMIEFINKLFL